MVQAFVGGLLITSIIALASLFGPSSVQAASAGQAAIGVLISVVEVTSAALSLAAPKHSSISEQEDESRRAGATAVIFFGVSSSLLLVALAIHSWLVRQPAYTQAVQAGDAAEYTELTTEEHGDSSDDEEHGLGDDKPVADLEVVTPLSERDLDIWHVSRLNIFYNSAIALTFFITLVSVSREGCTMNYTDRPSGLAVPVSAYHGINSVYPSTSRSWNRFYLLSNVVQRHPLPCIQWWRLPRSRSARLAHVHYLVRSFPSGDILCPDTVRSSFPHMQRSTRPTLHIQLRSVNCSYQLRFGLHGHSTLLRHYKWTHSNAMYDGRCIARP